MDAQLIAFSYAIGLKNGELSNRSKENIIKQIISSEIVNEIDTKLAINKIEELWSVASNVSFPLKINLTNLLLSIILIAFTEYKIILSQDLNLGINKDVIVVARHLLSYFENSQIQHHKNKIISFPNDRALLAFFHFQLKSSLNHEGHLISHDKGSTYFLFSLLKSLALVTQHKKYYNKTKVRSQISSEIIKLAIHKLKVDGKISELNETMTSLADENESDIEILNEKKEMEISVDDKTSHNDAILQISELGYNIDDVEKEYKKHQKFLANKNYAQTVFWLGAYLDENC
eukprot:528138_1